MVFHHAPEHLSGSAAEVNGTCRISLLWDIIAVLPLCSPPTSLNTRAASAWAPMAGEDAAISHSQAWHVCIIKKEPTRGESLGASHLIWLNHALLPLKCWKKLSCLRRDISLGTLPHLWEVSITTHSAQTPVHTRHVCRNNRHVTQHAFRWLLFFSPRKHDGFLFPFFFFFKRISQKTLLQMCYTCTIFSFEYSLFYFDSVS